jgi:hypothetical protein
MSTHVDVLFLFGGRARAMAIGLQREQHGECGHMHVVMAAGVAAMVMIVVIVVMVTAMMVVMMPAAMATAIVLWLAFVQRKRLAHPYVVFAHV